MVSQTNLPTNRSTSSTGHVADSNTAYQAINELTAWAQFDPTKLAPIVGSTVTVRKSADGKWPVSYNGAGQPVYTGGAADAGKRPTSSADVTVIWMGPDPSPAVVTTADGGMRDGIDIRLRTP